MYSRGSACAEPLDLTKGNCAAVFPGCDRAGLIDAVWRASSGRPATAAWWPRAPRDGQTGHGVGTGGPRHLHAHDPRESVHDRHDVADRGIRVARTTALGVSDA